MEEPIQPEEALDLQITENLQRKDVHPLKEAAGYQYLLDKDKKMNTAELALKFGKSETYILQRLKLNSLIEQAKKDFAAGDMSLAQALGIARLNPDDQAKVVKQCSDKAGGKKYPKPEQRWQDGKRPLNVRPRRSEPRQVEFIEKLISEKGSAQEALVWCIDQAIGSFKPASHEAGITVVRKEDLESWLSAIKESRQFKEQAETDIGWVAETIDRIQRVAAANPIKILSKVMMGGQDKLKELGLDPANLERLEQIAAKYAPLTYARLKSPPQIK